MESKKKCTVSVALPGCVLDKAQTPMLKAYLAGQIARALTIFKVNEVIIYSENGCKIASLDSSSNDPNLVLYKFLDFLETPPYLRKSLFPKSERYKFVAVIKPLESMHHPLKSAEPKYRDGVVKESKDGLLKVDVGLKNTMMVKKKSKTYKANERVSLRMRYKDNTPVSGKIVSTKHTRKRSLYYGYKVRLARGIKGVFENSPYKSGYDLTLGTSETGNDVNEVLNSKKGQFKHLLIVFGGPKGLENCLNERRQKFKVERLFDHYVSAGFAQGSRTIRTEEALLVVLGVMSRFLSN